MPHLVVVSRSLADAASPEALRILKSFLALIRRESEPRIIVFPEGFELNPPASAELVPYPGQIGIERSPELFSALRANQFHSITVLGSQPVADGQEIVLACYLSAERKQYLGSAGHSFDIAAKWQPHIRPSFGPREVWATRLPQEMQERYISNVHRWLADQIRDAGFGRPTPVFERRPETLLYTDFRLAEDLAQQTFELQIESFGASFSTLRLTDGTIVHSGDFYRSMANFLGSIPDVQSILDVGCGSGFLTCYLAGLGRYRSIVGVDASPQRVAGAQLHAELAGLPSVEFRQMSMDRLELPDASVDIAISSFALEQSGEALERVISELRRVARKYLVLFEPSTEYFPTFASIWHVSRSGWANRYFRVLTNAGVSFAVRPNLLGQYYNPGTVFVVDLQTDKNPVITLSHLFRDSVHEWPGGVRLE
jgi:SAM-dependent methyltransferase